jgi:hypothetical protein
MALGKRTGLGGVSEWHLFLEFRLDKPRSLGVPHATSLPEGHTANGLVSTCSVQTIGSGGEP